MFLGKEAHPHKYSFAKLMPKESVNRPLFLGSFCFVLLRFFQKKPHEKKKKEKFKNKREKHTIKSIIIIFAQKSFFFCSHSHSSFGASGGKRRDGGERSIFFSLRFKIDSRLELKQRGHQKWTRKT
tara:strand:+ start:3909 stop:4286 length:378 start_codon:yes stop_codon:yes gene_type:complete